MKENAITLGYVQGRDGPGVNPSLSLFKACVLADDGRLGNCIKVVFIGVKLGGNGRGVDSEGDIGSALTLAYSTGFSDFSRFLEDRPEAVVSNEGGRGRLRAFSGEGCDGELEIAMGAAEGAGRMSGSMRDVSKGTNCSKVTLLLDGVGPEWFADIACGGGLHHRLDCSSDSASSPPFLCVTSCPLTGSRSTEFRCSSTSFAAERDDNDDSNARVFRKLIETGSEISTSPPEAFFA